MREKIYFMYREIYVRSDWQVEMSGFISRIMYILFWGDLLIKKAIARKYAVLLYLQEKPNGTAALLIFS